MFRRLLCPLDGSPLSTRALRRAVALAADSGAELVGFHAAPDYHPVAYEDLVARGVISPARFAAATDRKAARILAPVTRACAAAGVKCRVRHVVHDHPWQAIIAAARRERCDLIVMASHGRRGLAGLLLGSETSRVLTHSRIPVLVVR
ncbi:MAG: universal stress protein [Pseudomonadota bacterium]|jgi:nucleotide-binding universal stress UspA family protein